MTTDSDSECSYVANLAGFKVIIVIVIKIIVIEKTTIIVIIVYNSNNNKIIVINLKIVICKVIMVIK